MLPQRQHIERRSNSFFPSVTPCCCGVHLIYHSNQCYSSSAFLSLSLTVSPQPRHTQHGAFSKPGRSWETCETVASRKRFRVCERQTKALHGSVGVSGSCVAWLRLTGGPCLHCEGWRPRKRPRFESPPPWKPCGCLCGGTRRVKPRLIALTAGRGAPVTATSSGSKRAAPKIWETEISWHPGRSLPHCTPTDRWGLERRGGGMAPLSRWRQHGVVLMHAGAARTPQTAAWTAVISYAIYLSLLLLIFFCRTAVKSAPECTRQLTLLLLTKHLLPAAKCY